MKRPILLVEDDPLVSNLLRTWLLGMGYAVDSANDGRQALGVLDRNKFDLVVSDLAMPHLDGLGLVRALSAFAGDPPIIILTGLGTVESAVEAMKYGAVDFLEKPVDLKRFNAAVTNAIRALDERRALLAQFHGSASGIDEVRAVLGAIRERRDRDVVLEALASALDVRERETGKHSVRVSKLASVLGESCGLSSADVERLGRGAVLHDIGKIGLPDSVLFKPGPLDPAEWTLVKRHPEIGARLVEPFGFLAPTVDVILSHHERFDGAGYPQGLKGHEIPLLARIFTIIDSFDAILSPRAYSPGRGFVEAYDEIVREAGTQFDPDIVAVFASIPAGRWSELHRSAEA